MKKNRLLAAVVLATLVFFLLPITNLFAERTDVSNIHDTIMPKNNYMISAEPELDFDPGANGRMYATAYFRFGAGLTEHIDISCKYGTTTGAKPYYGAHLETHFIKTEFINFATSIGAHYRNGAILDYTPAIIHNFEKFSIATGPEFNWKITRDKKIMLDIFLGISIPFARSMKLTVDVGFPILNDTYWISTGWAAYF